MAKGVESKKAIFSKLKEIYKGAFWEDEGKILRIPLNEEGNRVEIKVTLTAAKTNLGGDQPESAFSSSSSPGFSDFTIAKEAEKPAEDIAPTEEEKNNVAKMLASLGL